MSAADGERKPTAEAVVGAVQRDPEGLHAGVRVIGPTEYKVAARLNRARKRAPL
jgi:hypothetical protein